MIRSRSVWVKSPCSWGRTSVKNRRTAAANLVMGVYQRHEDAGEGFAGSPAEWHNGNSAVPEVNIMPFVITLAFATEHDRDAFREKILPRLRGSEVDPEGDAGDPPGLFRAAVSVTSHSAARDVCHQLNSFLVKAQ